MKFNWGHGIVVFFAVFMTFILTAVFKSTHYDVNLVTEDYYAEEVGYDKKIQKIKNAKAMKLDFEPEQQGSEVLLSFPENLIGAEGTVHFYRPSDRKLDFEVPLALGKGARQPVDLQKDIRPGQWVIKVSGEKNGKSFFMEKQLYLAAAI